MFSARLSVRAGLAAQAAATRSYRSSLTMPLRAKILRQQAQMSLLVDSDDQIFKARPGDEPEDVIFSNLYGLRTIELNRPGKLNSLNSSMIRKIAPRLIEWQKSDMANVIVMKGAGDRAFCAGGDVATLAKWNQKGSEGQKQSAAYFALEYQLDHFIATLDTPYVAFMDGITMGGGVGLSIHAPLRIATERTVFAMPETAIGFFPDVGASYFLPRLSGSIGTYLALTGARLEGVNVFYTGLATHYLHSTSLSMLESRLAELTFKDSDSLQTRLWSINKTIEEFCTGLPHDVPMTLAGEIRRAIDRCFSHDSVPQIMEALKAEENPATTAWAKDVLDTLHQRSPTSVHVALRQMRVGGEWSIKNAFRNEYQMATEFMASHDFNEGVTAQLSREKRGQPRQWRPATLEDITPEMKITDRYFKHTHADAQRPQLKLWHDGPKPVEFRAYCVPSDEDVAAKVDGKRSQKDIIVALVKQAEGKQGVREVAREIVQRITEVGDRGQAVLVKG